MKSKTRLHFLLVEDHVDLAANIYDYFEALGHMPDAAPDGGTGLRLLRSNEYDAVVLDVMLPDFSGLELCGRVRGELHKRVPILMLTARDTLEDKLNAFDAGADDYVVKPFELRELEARLLALNRRAVPGLCSGSLLEVGDLQFDEETLAISRQGQRISLNPACRKILAVLMRHSPRVVSRNSLETALWGNDPPASDALRTHIYWLRRAIDEPFGAAMLHTVSGAGYRLVPPAIRNELVG